MDSVGGSRRAAEAAVHDGCRALRLPTARPHRPLDTMHRADLFREANELHGWIEVEDGKITDYGQTGRGRIGITRLKLGPKEIAVPAVAMPTLQNAEVGDGWVRFTQTAGGRTGTPAPQKRARQAVLPDQLGDRVDDARADDSRRRHHRARARRREPVPAPLDLRQGRRACPERAARSTSTSGTARRTSRTRRGANEDSPAVVTAVESAAGARALEWRSWAATAAAPTSVSTQATSSSSRAGTSDGFSAASSCSTACSRWLSTVRWSVSSAQARSSASARRSRMGLERRRSARRRPAKVVGIPGEELNREALEEVAAGHRREDN